MFKDKFMEDTGSYLTISYWGTGDGYQSDELSFILSLRGWVAWKIEHSH